MENKIKPGIKFIMLIFCLLLSKDSIGQLGWYPLTNVIPVSYKTIYFFDSNTGFIGGDGNTLIRTINGGITWNDIHPGPFFMHMSGLSFINSSVGWLCAGVVYSTTNSYFYFVFKTTDQGLTWNMIYNTGLSGQVHYYFPGSIKFLNANTGIMTFWGLAPPSLQTQIGKILRTTDGGISWNRVDSNHAFYSVTGIDNKLVAAGYYIDQNYSDTGYIKTSTDWGATWKESLKNPHSGYFSADMTNPNTIFASGYITSGIQYATISKSTNFGRDWAHNQVRSNRFFKCIDMLDTAIGWAAGSSGLICKTTNSGNNWYTQFNSSGQQLDAIFFANSSHGFSAGPNNFVVKTTTGGELTSFYNVSGTSLPSEYFLHQNYPNPFNPITDIYFDIPDPSDVKLEIFDLKGRLIKTLLNEYKIRGSHAVSFDTSLLSSGVYFYRIKTPSFVFTRKMILMK